MPAVVVLGMHRSGTSAISRVLHALGAWLGSEASVTRRYEHGPIQAVNEKLLRRLGGEWSAPPALEPGWEQRNEARELRGEAADALADLRDHELCSWKDPRSCLTLPLWRELLDAPPVVVLSYRHPEEVAASLSTRNGFGPAHAYALWEAYNLGALRNARGLRTVVVPYDELVSEPLATTTRLRDALVGFGLPVAGEPAVAAGEVSTERRHHTAADLDPGVATPSQQALWALLTGLGPPSGAFDAGALPTPHPASAELLATRAALLHAGLRGDELERELRSRRALVRRLVEPRRSTAERAARS